MNLLDDGGNNILGDVYRNGLDTINAQSGFNFDETDDFLKSISGVLGKPSDMANVNLNNVNYNSSILSPSSINGEEVDFQSTWEVTQINHKLHFKMVCLINHCMVLG